MVLIYLYRERNIYWYYYFQLKALNRLSNSNKPEFLIELDTMINRAFENNDTEMIVCYSLIYFSNNYIYIYIFF